MKKNLNCVVLFFGYLTVFTFMAFAMAIVVVADLHTLGIIGFSPLDFGENIVSMVILLACIVAAAVMSVLAHYHPKYIDGFFSENSGVRGMLWSSGLYIVSFILATELTIRFGQVLTFGTLGLTIVFSVWFRLALIYAVLYEIVRIEEEKRDHLKLKNGWRRVYPGLEYGDGSDCDFG